jgi:hypothetical protein
MIANEVLKFEIDKMELIEELSNSQFAKVKVWCFATGDNLHDRPILLSALKMAENTIFNKPLTMAYDARRDDASNHSPQQVPVGMVSLDAKTSYELTEDGRIFFCVEALIWKYYSGRVLQIFDKADDNEKQVSVEINVLEYEDQENGKKAISAYAYRCITILGDIYNSAIPDAKAQIIEFAKAKEEYEQQIFSTNTSAESQNNDSNEDVNIDLQNKSKEDEGMTFNKEEFAKTCGYTATEMSEKLYAACGTAKYMDGEYESTRFYMRDYSAEYAFAYDYMSKRMMAIPYSFADGEVTMNFEGAKPARMTYVLENEGEDSVVDELMELLSKLMYEKETSFATEKETLEKELEATKEKFAEVESKVSTLETEISSAKESFSALEAENTTLKTFKVDVEKQVRDNEIEFAIREVAEDIGQVNVDEWKGKAETFESVEAFSNALKSFAYELTKGKKKGKKEDKEEFSRISLPSTNVGENEPQDCWTKLKSKITK